MSVEQLNESIVKAQPIRFTKNLTASSWSDCDRALWFTYRNASNSDFKAETLRTFKMGHLLEDAIVEWLTMAGYKIILQQAEIKNQWDRPLGHIDGVIFYDNEWMLLEIKTANDKRFKEWLKNGAPDSYKAQTQLYMHHSHQISKKGNKLNKVLFVVLNKNTSEIHMEVNLYDKQYAQLQTDRIEHVIENESVPSPSPSFKCNFCNHKDVCEGTKLARIDSCGTCANLSIVDGAYQCQFGNKRCDNHVLHPQLVELIGEELKSINHEHQALIFNKFALAPTGQRLAEFPTFDSNELKIAFENNLINDKILLEHKEMVDATIVTVDEI